MFLRAARAAGEGSFHPLGRGGLQGLLMPAENVGELAMTGEDVKITDKRNRSRERERWYQGTDCPTFVREETSKQSRPQRIKI